MRKLNRHLNQEGISLLEVLISISILTLIFVTILNIFPQMGFLNQKNESKLQGMNTAKQVLIQWQEDSEVVNYLRNPEIYPKPTKLVEKESYFINETSRNQENIIVEIARASDLNLSAAQEGPTKIHQIHVQIKNNKNTLIGESFGYLVLEE